MTLEEARTIWLTLFGSEWVQRYDVMVDSQYEEVIRPAYRILRTHSEIEIDFAREMIKIKCKS